MKNRCFLSMLIALSMVFTIVPSAVFAQGPEVPNGAFENGNNQEFTNDEVTESDKVVGTQSAPFLISTKEDLKALATFVNGGVNPKGYTNNEDSYYQMTADIDLAGENWVPIGEGEWDENAFHGTFDGNGYVIKNLTIQSVDSEKGVAGLFGWGSGSCRIQNLGVIDCSIDALNSAGAVVAAMAGDIENCFSTGTIKGGQVGGIAGVLTIDTSISDSDNDGVDDPESCGSIKNCYSTAEISGIYQAGGIVGSCNFGKELVNTYSTANVESTDPNPNNDSRAGGITSNYGNWGMNPKIANNVSLGQIVRTANDAYAVCRVGGNFSGNGYDNFAWKDMRLYYKTNLLDLYIDSNPKETDGEDITCENGILSHQFSDIFQNDSAWNYEDNKLPTLKVFEGKTSYHQSSNLPDWMMKGGKLPTPEALFDPYTLVLSNVTDTMQYSQDEGATWNVITGTSATLNIGDLVVGQILVQNISTDDKIANSDYQIISLSDVYLSPLVEVMNPDAPGKMGTLYLPGRYMDDHDVEYRNTADKNWKTVNGRAIPNLAPGTYEVRLKRTDLLNGYPTVVEIKETDAAYAITAAPAVIDFGTCPQNQLSSVLQREITISNIGTEEVWVAGFPHDFDIDLELPTNGIQISAGSTATFHVNPSQYLDPGVYEDFVIFSTHQGNTALVNLKITVTPSSDYFLTVNGSYASNSGEGAYTAGQRVRIDAGSRSGYVFDGWSSTNGTVKFDRSDSARTYLTMPDANVTVWANWVPSGGGGGSGGSSGGGLPSGGGSTTKPIKPTEPQKPTTPVTPPTPAVPTWEKSGSLWKLKGVDGKYQTGWAKVEGAWYYLKSDGVMATGWQKVGKTWYYLTDSGSMKTGWLKLNNVWYYLKASGAMAAGWLQVGNTWYFMDASGAMKTGWLKEGGTWYYLKPSGAMATGWTWIGNRCYYLYPNGKMASNTTIDGYRIDATGAWKR
ncbi:InlB B-repeat-containing protein [Fumia xinanensis]|uniref:N-acetylmuramoyl-L-alanine amidase family protein n=1 Tax=Fumia xinanensis TaxID=2763659 RepID=A0A926I2P3_9FIRM|nr:hypothetical protein [Fumia xinanensis]MBC8559768.1 N-acetylmuramoyl-L-alanine amidase family protein [Fumia xinanensis]